MKGSRAMGDGGIGAGALLVRAARQGAMRRRSVPSRCSGAKRAGRIVAGSGFSGLPDHPAAAIPASAALPRPRRGGERRVLALRRHPAAPDHGEAVLTAGLRALLEARGIVEGGGFAELACRQADEEGPGHAGPRGSGHGCARGRPCTCRSPLCHGGPGAARREHRGKMPYGASTVTGGAGPVRRQRRAGGY